ncbi:MAG TPA: HD domain-containing protein [Usitatibacter sp.]|nr:HD domain-containing protein [Usitatibacter sp.]
MNFRRSDFDVTNRINTTDPVCVKLEVARIFRTLHARTHAPALSQAFDDMVRLYRGEFPGYTRCDTQYHDLQHVLEVTLAMARLLDGYERTRGEGPAISEKLFQLGVICALYHDCGYIRRDNDRKHRNGAEYTMTHVSRGGRFLREYLATLGLRDVADIAAEMLHFTGYEKPIAAIRVPPIYRLVGSLLGSADIIAQMSDRCYLEKCRDRLYPEFVAGGLTYRVNGDGERELVFSSGEDLLRKTPTFYAHASKRLDEELDGAYRFAQAHFGGANLYMDALKQNIRFVERIGAQGQIVLRRQPPVTV